MNSNYDIIFVTTFTNLQNIFELLESTSNNNQRVSVLFVLVAQNNLQIDTTPFLNFHTQIQIINNKNTLGLSAARNIALHYIFENKITSNYIMFPDDDSSFDLSFFTTFESKVRGNTLIDVYCTGSKDQFNPTRYLHDSILSSRNYQAATSVNMIIDYSLVQRVGYFDEKMGVGAEYGAGEDGDYFIRCCKACINGFRYEKGMWNYHPRAIDKYKAMTFNQLIIRYRNYGRGVIYMLCKHRFYPEALNCIFSALFGSLISFIKLDIKLGTARAYAFFIRFSLFFKLIFRQRDNFKHSNI